MARPSRPKSMTCPICRCKSKKRLRGCHSTGPDASRTAAACAGQLGTNFLSQFRDEESAALPVKS